MCSNPGTHHVFGHGSALLLAVARLLVARQRVCLYPDGDVPATVSDLVDRGLVELSHANPPECAVSAESLESLPVPPRSIEVRPGDVWLVGAGPGAEELMTVGSLDVISQADVIVTDRLVPMRALAHVSPGAEVVDVAKIPRGEFTSQEAINQCLIDEALGGKRVVRVKGGDPYLFGRGMEERLALEAHGVVVHELPGVSSSYAVPSMAHIPPTHRGVAQSVSVVSGHVPPGDSRSTVNWGALARVGGTIVVMMGVNNAALIATALRSGGMSADTPCAATRDQGLDDTQNIISTLGAVAENGFPGLTPPAVIVIGDVCTVRAEA